LNIREEATESPSSLS